MKKNSILGFLIIVFAVQACKDDDAATDALTNVYEMCCETGPIALEVGVGQVYIPNIITPNSDGINDIFGIYADSEIESLEQITIKNREGVSIVNRTDVPVSNFYLLWEADEATAPNGLYSYEATIRSVDGTTASVNSSVCVYRCKTPMDSILMNNIVNCGFGTQHNGIGGIDIFAPSLESPTCF